MKRMIFLPAVAVLAMFALLGPLSAQNDTASPRAGTEGFSGLEAAMEEAASALGMEDSTLPRRNLRPTRPIATVPRFPKCRPTPCSRRRRKALCAASSIPM